MKKYKAVFFDWDGTAVFSRTCLLYTSDAADD